jgi:hypothetical protein
VRAVQAGPAAGLIDPVLQLAALLGSVGPVGSVGAVGALGTRATLTVGSDSR